MKTEDQKQNISESGEKPDDGASNDDFYAGKASKGSKAYALS